MINLRYVITVPVFAHITNMAASNTVFGKQWPDSCLPSASSALKDADAARVATSSACVGGVLERELVRFAIGPFFKMLLALLRY